MLFVRVFLLYLLALATATRSETSLPVLELPWGTWEASVFENDKEIYVFHNVRFGAPPERFGRPASPTWKSSAVQHIDQDISCIQVNLQALSDPPGGRLHLGEPETPEALQTEDCLFLDIYVPVRAFDSAALLPVVVWVYGGAYASGSKNPGGLPLGSGQSVLRASGYQTIFVTGNYRLGALGWLAGDYLQTVGQPNAGLYDQALLFEWVQQYIAQVQGDKTRVSAWGESAGAGSILHHLVREDGTRDPLFQTFAALSPAFQWAWDNAPGGALDSIYRTFSNLTGCGFVDDIDCLREAAVEKVQRANQMLFDTYLKIGLFPVGPAVDGDWVKSIPTITFSQGQNNSWKDIKSAIISHCANEALFFTPPYVTDEPGFDDFLSHFLPGAKLEPVRGEIKKQYNCTEQFDGDFHKCLTVIIQDSTFTCNTRDLFESYPAVSYALRYAFPLTDLAVHGADLLPLFANSDQEVINLVASLLRSVHLDPDAAQILGTIYAWLLGPIYPQYQEYFASFALSTNPNPSANPQQPLQSRLSWPVANGSGNELSGVMNVNWFGFHTVTDDQNTRSACSFWTGIAEELMAAQKDLGSERAFEPHSNEDIGEL